MKQIRKRLTYANVMSTIAVFLVLGGATAIAAGLAKNSVGSRQLKKEAVTSAKIKSGAVTAAKLGAGSVGSSAIQAGVIPDSYTKGESNGRYLRGTITVIGTIPAVAADSFQSGSVDCPAGYQAIGGGVDPFNVFFGKVSSSTPTYAGTRALLESAGQHGPATGWQGTVSTQGAGTGSTGASKVIVICSPIG